MILFFLGVKIALYLIEVFELYYFSNNPLPHIVDDLPEATICRGRDCCLKMLTAQMSLIGGHIGKHLLSIQRTASMDDKIKIYIKQFLKFNYIGVATVVIGAAVFILMIKIGFDYISALAGDYLVGILFSYFMNKKYTFKAKTTNDIPLLIKTFAMYIVSFSLNAILLKLCSEVYGFNLIYSQIVIISILALFNFLVFKLLIFRVVNER